MKYILLLLVLTRCANKTFVMPTVVTHPEERNVSTSYPVIPVESESIKKN